MGYVIMIKISRMFLHHNLGGVVDSGSFKLSSLYRELKFWTFFTKFVVDVNEV
jgi:hypothetical protein